MHILKRVNMTTFPSAFLSDLSSHTDNILIHRDWSWFCVLCLVWVKKRKEGKSCEERGVVTETGGDLSASSKHRTTRHTLRLYMELQTAVYILPHTVWYICPLTASKSYLSCLPVIYLMHQSSGELLSRSSCKVTGFGPFNL